MTSSRFNRDENPEERKPSDFSIEHILTKAGQNCAPKSLQQNKNLDKAETIAFPWLHCTRYCPPKIPRSQKKEGSQKRQLGRHPRIPFTSHQLTILEERFKKSPYLSSEEVTQLSSSLKLADVRVKIWFQNRRARERREKNNSESNLLLKPTTSTQVQPELRLKSENFLINPTTSPINFTSNFLVPNTTQVIGSAFSVVPNLSNLLCEYNNFKKDNVP